VPMLPNVAGAAETRKQILLYSLILVPTTFLPSLLGTTGLLYTIVTALLGAAFLWHAVDVYRLREGEAARRACRRLFGFSILYLFVIFALIIAERILGIAAFAPVVG
jgi:protoheme IX farnesyltransferase